MLIKCFDNSGDYSLNFCTSFWWAAQTCIWTRLHKSYYIIKNAGAGWQPFKNTLAGKVLISRWGFLVDVWSQLSSSSSSVS